jgi:hypothetical protein
MEIRFIVPCNALHAGRRRGDPPVLHAVRFRPKPPLRVGPSLVLHHSVQMDSHGPGSTVVPRKQDAASLVPAPAPTTSPDDSPSPAELAFIERVRGDRQRARTLRHRALVTAGVAAAAIGALVFRDGMPRWPTSGVPGTRALPATLDARPAGLEDRLARLEARVRALEDVTPVVEHPSQPLPLVTHSTSARDSASGAPSPPRVGLADAPRSRPHPTGLNSVAARQSSVPQRNMRAASAESPKRVPVVSAARRTVPQRDTRDVTLGERVRRGWAVVARQVRQTPGDVREGFDKVRRVFAD